jgi:hypothetical protein
VRRHGIDVHEMPHSSALPRQQAIGGAGDHQPAVAVADQDHLVELFALHQVDDVGQVRVERDAAIEQVRPFAHAGERDGVRAVAGRAQHRQHTRPTPGPVPGAVDEHEGGHRSRLNST